MPLLSNSNPNKFFFIVVSGVRVLSLEGCQFVLHQLIDCFVNYPSWLRVLRQRTNTRRLVGLFPVNAVVVLDSHVTQRPGRDAVDRYWRAGAGHRLHRRGHA